MKQTEIYPNDQSCVNLKFGIANKRLKAVPSRMEHWAYQVFDYCVEKKFTKDTSAMYAAAVDTVACFFLLLPLLTHSDK